MTLLFGRLGRWLFAVTLLLASAQGNAKVFKIATLSPDGSSWMKTMRTAAAEIAEETEGRVKFKFYPGGVMGSDDAVMRKIRVGQLQGAALPGGALSDFYPDLQIYNLPLKFQTFGEVDYVRERMDAKIVAGLEKGGFVTFGLAEGGFAYVLSKAAVRSVDDLTSRKVWIPNNDEAALLAVNTFGVDPVPLHLSDVLAGLQTGLVDTVASSPIGSIALHWHTQVKYMSDLPIMYLFAMLAIDKKAFGRLSEEDKSVVKAKMTAAFEVIDQQNRRDNVAAYDALLQQGIELVSPTDSQRELWYSMALKAQQNMVDNGVVAQETLDELDGYLESYRAANADAK